MKFRSFILALSSSLSLIAGSALAGDLHVFTSDTTGFNTHSFWYDDGKEITVVDSQFTPAIARALIADIRSKSTLPITRIIVTHPNPDKFNALALFHKEGAESIASAKTAAAINGVDAYKRYFWVKIAKAFTDETYPQVEAIKTSYQDKKVIKLKSGETISLFELKQPGVSSNQTVVRIDRTGDLIVGDLVHGRNHAWLEGGIVEGKAVPTLEGWKSGLKELLQIGRGKVYGGRGQFLPLKQAVTEEIAYLQKADAIVDTYIKNLGANTAELSDPSKQGAHYAAIQKEFEKAFPDYAMPDLIAYSVYGLVQQKLAK